MLAAWYERPGPAADVLDVGEMADLDPGPGEVRVRVAFSGINPGDTNKRGDRVGSGMPYPRVIPHSYGAGVVDAVGDGVASPAAARNKPQRTSPPPRAHDRVDAGGRARVVPAIPG